LVLICLLFGGVVVRLAQLQVTGAGRYVALGESQRVRPTTLPADRGSIFDRNGYDLALSISQRTVWTDPGNVLDPAGDAAALAPLLGLDPVALQAKLAAPSHFEYIARQVPDDVADQVEALALPGIYLLDEPKRFNPSDDLARSVLGRVDIDSGGIAGLELQYDDTLTGEPGELVIERDLRGRTIPAGEHQLQPAERGDDLVLTIDRAMQYETERALGAQIAAMGAKGGIAIVSDPRTGELLAIANLETPADGGPPRASGNNMALTTVFEPGSANKVITLSAALEEDIAAPSSTLVVPDHLQVSDHRFTDHDPHPTREMTVSEILTSSSNIGTIELAQALGAERIDEYMRRFGFGEKTALDFPNESPGLLLPLDSWSGTSIGSIPIGQGISVTALQMLEAYNVIANGGMYVAPKLVKATVDHDGVQHATPASEEHRVVSEQTAAQMAVMMADVVRHGTGHLAAIPGYTVGGKTGTARKPLPTGGYLDPAGHYHYVATFAGFVPVEAPQLSVIVVLDEPSASIYASEVSAPVFAQIAQYALRQFRIPPPAQALPESGTAPDGPVDTTQANDVTGDRIAPPPAPTSSTTSTTTP
jgi:cell division protein FtsI (penicillin-binding protein 3)